MYALIKNNVIEKYPYSEGQLKADNPQVSFPKEPSNALLATYDIYPVAQTPAPTSTETQVVESAGYTQKPDGTWATAWTVRSMTQEELGQLNRSKEQQRQFAYDQEADPLFFKWQRGEVEQQVWLDKVQEIKARYPNITIPQ